MFSIFTINSPYAAGTSQHCTPSTNAPLLHTQDYLQSLTLSYAPTLCSFPKHTAASSQSKPFLNICSLFLKYCVEREHSCTAVLRPGQKSIVWVSDRKSPQLIFFLSSTKARAKIINKIKSNHCPCRDYCWKIFNQKIWTNVTQWWGFCSEHVKAKWYYCMNLIYFKVYLKNVTAKFLFAPSSLIPIILQEMTYDIGPYFLDRNDLFLLTSFWSTFDFKTFVSRT